MKVTRITLIVLTTGFLLLTTAIILIAGTENTGYEVSIYAALPPLAWYLLIASIVCGIGVIVHEACARENSFWKTWLIGLLLLVAGNLVIFLLPVLRDYSMFGRHDNMTHIGYVKDILSTGHFSSFNLYPGLHMLIASLSQISGLSVLVQINYIGPLFSLFYVLCIYLLARFLLHKPREVMLATTSGTVLLMSSHHVTVAPLHLALMVSPLVLFLYLKTMERETPELKFPLIILLLFYVIFHPQVALVFVFVFIAIEFIKIGRWKLHKPTQARLPQPFAHTYVGLPALVFIVLMTWQIQHRLFKTIWEPVMRLILGQIPDVPQAWSRLTERIAMVGLGFTDIVQLLFKMYGHQLIFLVFTAIAFIIIMRTLFSYPKGNPHQHMKRLLFLQAWPTIGGILLILHFIRTPMYIGFERYVYLMVIISPIFVGVVLGRMPHYIRVAAILQGILIAAISYSAITGIFATYPSPYLSSPNIQISHAEINGMGWFYQNKDRKLMANHVRMTYRFADALLGFESRVRRDDIVRGERPSPWGAAPDHFAYDRIENLGYAYYDNTYLPISTFDKVYYCDIYRQLEKFNWNDFAKLDTDQSINKLYSNRELKIYLVYSLIRG